MAWFSLRSHFHSKTKLIRNTNSHLDVDLPSTSHLILCSLRSPPILRPHKSVERGHAAPCGKGQGLVQERYRGPVESPSSGLLTCRHSTKVEPHHHRLQVAVHLATTSSAVAGHPPEKSSRCGRVSGRGLGGRGEGDQ